VLTSPPLAGIESRDGSNLDSHETTANSCHFPTRKDSGRDAEQGLSTPSSNVQAARVVDNNRRVLGVHTTLDRSRY